MRELELSAISAKLDAILRVANLVGLVLIEGKKQTDQFALLSRAGFQPREIAELVGTTPNTVRVALSRIRKERKTPFRTRREIIDERQGRDD